MKMIIEPLTTFGGINPYIGKKAVLFTFSLSGIEHFKFLKNRFIHLLNVTPHDFDIKIPNNVDDLSSCYADLLLEALNYVRGDLRFCMPIACDDQIIIACDYHDPYLVIEVARLLVWIINVEVVDNTILLDTFDTIWNTCRVKHPDFQAHALIEYAKMNNISYNNIHTKFWVYGMGSSSKVFFETSLYEDFTTTTLTKAYCKDIFHELDVPTAKYKILQSHDAKINLDEVNLPCVVKPNDSNAGKGVTANITSGEQLQNAITYASEHTKSGELIVEDHINGSDHRLLFINGNFIGCVQHEGPYVVGDGRNSINNLIAVKNWNRTRSLYKSNYKRPIIIDDAVKNTLASMSMDLNSIPSVGEKVYLRSTVNLSGGGNSFLVDKIHPKILEYAQRIVDKLSLYSVGIDYITTDISKDPNIEYGAFTEANRTPGIPVFINAGYSLYDMGSHFLKNSCGNLPLRYIIVPAQSLFDVSFVKPFKSAFIYPKYVSQSGTIRPIQGNTFQECWGAYLAIKSLDEIIFIISDADLLKFGVIEEYSEIIVMDNIDCKSLAFLESCKLQYSVIQS